MTPEQFGITWDLIDEMNTDGTTHSSALASDKYYKKSVSAWVKYKKARRQSFAKSKSM